MRRHGWLSLLQWTLALGLVAYSVVGAMTVGMFVIPFALGAVVIVARRNRLWPESIFGALCGAAVVSLLIALLNREASPCPPVPRTVVLEPGERAQCGGRDPTPWLAAGVVLASTGLLGYALARPRHREAAT